MPAILADQNIKGQVNYLLELCDSRTWGELWHAIDCEALSFELLGLPGDASDAAIWQTCQDNEIVLITSNRNADGPESLEVTVRERATVSSLPILTIADPDRILENRDYAGRVVERLLEILIDLDAFRGAGRLYLP